MPSDPSGPTTEDDFAGEKLTEIEGEKVSVWSIWKNAKLSAMVEEMKVERIRGKCRKDGVYKQKLEGNVAVYIPYYLVPVLEGFSAWLRFRLGSFVRYRLE